MKKLILLSPVALRAPYERRIKLKQIENEYIF